MKKIDSSLLVCTAAQAQQLITLGILPIAVFCYESTGGVWDFAGEYVGQAPVLPAWTFQELCVIIGGDFQKPDIYSKRDWTHGANMLNAIVYLPKKRIEFPNTAQAAAALAIHLLTTRKNSLSTDTLLMAPEANARLEAFANGELYNPMTEALKPEQ